MEAGVRIESESPRTGERVHACTAYLTFVAQGEDGKSLPVPPLVLESDEDRRRFEDAARRRDERLARRKLRQARLDARPASAMTTAAGSEDGG